MQIFLIIALYSDLNQFLVFGSIVLALCECCYLISTESAYDNGLLSKQLIIYVELMGLGKIMMALNCNYLQLMHGGQIKALVHQNQLLKLSTITEYNAADEQLLNYVLAPCFWMLRLGRHFVSL